MRGQMRIDKSYSDPRTIVSRNAIDLKALNGKTHILWIPITISRLLINLNLLNNEITFSILSRWAPCVINWNALFDVMPGADAMDGMQHLKKKTNTSTEKVPSPYVIYIVPWRLINLSEWKLWRQFYYPLNQPEERQGKKWIFIIYPIFVTKKLQSKLL